MFGRRIIFVKYFRILKAFSHRLAFGLEHRKDFNMFKLLFSKYEYDTWYSKEGERW